MPISLTEFASFTQEQFVETVGKCYENSPWVAEAAYTQRDGLFETVTALHAAMKAVVEGSSLQQKTDLINAHPDLAGKAALAGEVTAESSEEQSKAGLSSLTTDEMASFTEMNTAYKAKFGFVFILAVRNASKSTILGCFKARLQNSREKELNECIRQIHKIAWMRLLTTIEPKDSGFLTCHVLDTASGKPANDMRITLSRLSGEGELGLIKEYVTNDDGRLTGGPALKGTDFSVGVYEWIFYSGDYFLKECQQVDGTPFLNEVPIRFGIDNPEDHYHVPLLVSPYSFSTYRGS
jgi:2-oxo-4-hydroxy-4-carboxy-5-ureidoimidazoline decarboxylase